MRHDPETLDYTSKAIIKLRKSTYVNYDLIQTVRKEIFDLHARLFVYEVIIFTLAAALVTTLLLS